MSTPRTEAGRALLTELAENPLDGARYAHHVVRRRLGRIEAEAAEAERARLRAALRKVLDECERFPEPVNGTWLLERIRALAAAAQPDALIGGGEVNYYKATRPNGRDFYTNTIDYAAALSSGEVIRHPDRPIRNMPETYFSVSVEPADCSGFEWPCRLFRVEPVGRVMANLDASPNKRAVSALRVVEELPAHRALGPNGEQVAAFIERCRTLTSEQVGRLADAGEAAWDAPSRAAAWVAVRGAASRAAAREAAGVAARAALAAVRAAAWAAAEALVVRDLITPDQFAILVQPFVDAGLGEWVYPAVSSEERK